MEDLLILYSYSKKYYPLGLIKTHELTCYKYRKDYVVYKLLIPDIEDITYN
jgi:hypothetical protein